MKTCSTIKLRKLTSNINEVESTDGLWWIYEYLKGTPVLCRRKRMKKKVKIGDKEDLVDGWGDYITVMTGPLNTLLNYVYENTDSHKRVEWI